MSFFHTKHFVVMLILAGVTINLTLGENGIFSTAQQAAKNYTHAQNKEQEDLAYFTNIVDNIAKGNTTLTSQITGADYGKYINYSVTVDGTVLDKWRVFYNDKSTGNVYIILDGYLPRELTPEVTDMETSGEYNVYWGADKFSTNQEAVQVLNDTEKWDVFAQGVEGAIATGGPTNRMFVNSWNSNSAVSSTTLTVENEFRKLTDSSKLYFPFTTNQSGCFGYWLCSVNSENTTSVWLADCGGNVFKDYNFDNPYYGVRPVVCLPTQITGTIGSSVSIDK